MAEGQSREALARFPEAGGRLRVDRVRQTPGRAEPERHSASPSAVTTGLMSQFSP
ncbi:hypothetical protein [Streptomyces sp. NPDC005209]|uniref:hypothetical protein n=1 Tax=Streptomyces sp. NPDC005209 TaxID=3156715 RepID=UPI0033BC0190